MTKRVDGELFRQMLENGLANLILHEEELNDLNVFPVADGDTGTNMRKTLENGLKTAARNEHLNSYLKSLARGMLLGARGNSGVILSQLFRGMALELTRYNSASAWNLRNAFARGYKTAYEGTPILVSNLLGPGSRGGHDPHGRPRERGRDPLPGRPERQRRGHALHAAG